MNVDLTETEIRALLYDGYQITTDGLAEHAESARAKLRAAQPVEHPIGTIAYVYRGVRKYGPMHRVEGGWADDPGREDYCDTPDANITKVEPVRIMPVDHISIPRRAVNWAEPWKWRSGAVGGLKMEALYLDIATALEAEGEALA